jgi:hypothetical protein
VRQKVSRADSNPDREGASENAKTPSEEGVSSFLVTDFQKASVDVSSGGGGNCTRVPRIATSAFVGTYAASRRQAAAGRAHSLRIIFK